MHSPCNVSGMFGILTILSQTHGRFDFLLARRIKRKSKILFFYCKFQLKSLKWYSCHTTTLFHHPSTLLTSINYSWRCQSCAECLALWSNDLHPRPRPRGITVENPSLRILLPQEPRPIHRMDDISIPIRRSANHLLPFYCNKREQWTPTPPDILSPAQQQQSLRHSQRLRPLGLHANAWSDATVCIHGRWHWLQQDVVLVTDNSPFVRPTIHWDR